MVASIFQPALAETAAASIERTTGWPNSQWGLGLALNRDDCPGRRRKNSGFCAFGCSFIYKFIYGLQGMVLLGHIILLIRHLVLLLSVAHKFYPLLILRCSRYGRRRRKLYMHSDTGVSCMVPKNNKYCKCMCIYTTKMCMFFSK